MTKNAIKPTKTRLREQGIAIRSALDPEQRQRLDESICTHLLQWAASVPGRRIAAYIAFRGEPDLMPALRQMHVLQKMVHLPVLRPDGIEFCRWQPGDPMRRNRFGIPEPADTPVCPAKELDLVLMPLVAFSNSGIRLGMGGGYYDRAFSFRQAVNVRKPVLTGVAYRLQRLETLSDQAEPWDVPLDSVLTECGLRTFRE